MNQIVLETLRNTAEGFVKSGMMKSEHLDRMVKILENRTEDKRPYLTIRQTAEFLQLNERTIRRWIDEGLLPAVRIAGTVRIDPADIAELPKEKSRQRQRKPASEPVRRR